MATLQEQLRKTRRLPTGELEVVPLTDLVERAELPTTPRTALGAAMIGATPQQQQMMGTPQQRQAAITRVAETETLAEARRRQAQPGQPPPDVRAQKVEKLTTSLGQLGTKVQEYVDTAAAQLAPVAPTLQLTSTEGLSPEQISQLQAAVTSPTPETLAQTMQALGAATPEELQTKLSQYTDSQTAQALAQTARQIAPPTIGAVLGPESAELSELSQILGEDVSTLTLPQIEERIQQFEEEELADVNRLRQLSQDPALSESDRRLVTSQLQQMGASGVLASPEQLDDLISQVDQAQTVEFGGRDYTLEDLLGDEGLTAMISGYLNDESLATSLRESEPQFAQWIDRNRAALEALEAETFTQPVAQLKAQYDKYQETKDELGLDDQMVRDVLGPEFLTFTTDLESNAVVQNLRGATPEERTRWTDSVTKVWNAKGTGDLAALTGGRSLKDVISDLSNYRKWEGRAHPNEDQILDLIDANRDGQPDSFDEVQSRLKAALKSGAEAGVIRGLDLSPPPAPSPLFTHPETSGILRDGMVSEEDLDQVHDPDLLRELTEATNAGRVAVSREASAELNRIMEQQSDRQIRSVWAERDSTRHVATPKTSDYIKRERSTEGVVRDEKVTRDEIDELTIVLDQLEQLPEVYRNTARSREEIRDLRQTIARKRQFLSELDQWGKVLSHRFTNLYVPRDVLIDRALRRDPEARRIIQKQVGVSIDSLLGV